MRERLRNRLSNRRGATAIFVALLMLPILGFTAWVVDLGEWQAGAAQLQTAADASALAGARKMELTVGAARELQVKVIALATGSKNLAFGAAVVIDSSDITPKIWNSATSTLSNAPDWASANAVQVIARSTGNRYFGGIFGNAAPQVRRRGVAWVANINSGKCVKPWGLPYEALYARIRQLTGIGSAPVAGVPSPGLSQDQLLAIGNLPEEQRFIVFRPPTYDGQGGNPDSSAALGNLNYNNGMYTAFNFTAVNNNASGTTYQASISDCSPVTTTLGTNNTAMLPGANDIPCLTVNAIMGSRQNSCHGGWPGNLNIQERQTCEFASLQDARCYRPTSNANSQSDTVAVAWVDQTSGNSNGSSFRLLGKIKVLCMFRNLPATATETCTYNNTMIANNYPRGTMIGIIQGITQPQIDPGTTLGNVISDQQKLVLIQ